MRYGYSGEIWEPAPDEATAIVRRRAAEPMQDVICYLDLCERMQTVQFAPDSFALRNTLGQISAAEYRAGRGMLTAIVVDKDGDQKPGYGFV
jgi:hypothetical protein